MNTKVIAILLIFIFFSSVVIAISTAETGEDVGDLPRSLKLSTSLPEYGIKGQTISFRVFSDGLAVSDVDVYVVFNDGVPIHIKTNEDGTVGYKPLLTGGLNITAKYKGSTVEKVIRIYEPFYDVNISSNVTERTVETQKVATYLLTVKNTGNTTDTINLTKKGKGSLSKTSVTLNAKISEKVTLNVSGSTPGTYTTTVTVTSNKDPEKSDFVTLKTKVKDESTGVNGGKKGGGGTTSSPGIGRGVSPTKIKIDKNGMVLLAYTEESPDKKAKLVVPKGTIALDFEGNRLRGVDIIPITLDGYVVGAYNLKPDYATFDPYALLVMMYNSTEAKDRDLTIRIYEYGTWSELETKINQSEHTATAKISHFTPFALFAEANEYTTTKVMTQISPTPEESPAVSMEKHQPVVPWSLVIVAIMAVLIMLVILYIWGK